LCDTGECLINIIQVILLEQEVLHGHIKPQSCGAGNSGGAEKYSNNVKGTG